MQEPLELQLDLVPNYWNMAPKIKVAIDDVEIFSGTVTEAKTIKWSGDLDNGSHTFTIELCDKNKYQTIVEDGKIVKDQIIKVAGLFFDDIEIGFIKWSDSEYRPNPGMYPDAPEVVPMTVDLGYNGKWTLPFTTPIYIWLLEKL